MRNLFFALVLAGGLMVTGYACTQDTASTSMVPYTSLSPASGRDVFGNPLGMDVHGNPNDRNAQGLRPKDVHGNPPKDMYGNKTGSE